MTQIEDMKNEKGAWLFVVPVSGLTLTKSVSEEISIDKITFVSRSRLPRVRKRLGFPVTVGELKTTKMSSGFFEVSDVCAVAKLGGIGAVQEKAFLDAAKDELAILSLSQLGYARRRHNACLSISSENRPGFLEYFMMNTVKRSWALQHRLSGRFNTLVLDKKWKKYQKFSFFYELLRLLNGRYNVTSGWKRDIRNAAVLAGQSQSSSDLPHAFLWNMIAIETLLTHQGDSYSVALPKRVEAFIGWTTDWSVRNFESKIEEVYKKRCAFVHAGKSDGLRIEDVLFTDVLLVNIFYNILKHISMFETKEKLIEFSRKVEAEHVLGAKPNVRPKTVSFISMRYSDKDYENI
ncbi:hypothetical protein TspCOW1_11630 [Thiohalobacter sp. COW1]|uniref:hypothetical protein n=1 Tax=Thiohalobacter sp. COW1 TaxID=2795687 RepID=UPI00191667BE|nr:hypothetical protein [Thiohalobacter sp. COW1]BCO31060.1 hypothetical protein TspCOW1_11630 [Thiohalobacter sp. COW1]